MTTSKTSSRWVVRSIVSAVLLVAIAGAATLMALAWHFSGYEPDHVISLSGILPLAVTSDGATLIAGTVGKYKNVGFTPHVVSPIRFLDLATGMDSQTTLALPQEPNENPDKITVGSLLTTISDVKLADDEKRLVVVRTQAGMAHNEAGNYFLTVFNLSTRALILEKTIPWTYNPTYPPLVQLSRDGRLLAWLNTQRLVVIWDLDVGKERCHCEGGPASLQLSPDGKLLATRDALSSSEVRLFDTTTGALAHTINLGDKDLGYRAFGSTTAFSTDSKFVAVDGGQEGSQLRTVIQVIDTVSGKECFRTQGFHPQFLPGGSLLGIRGTGRQMPFGEGGWEILETVVWSSAGWTEMRASPYNLGVSLFSGPLIPQPSPNGRPDQFALTYRTDGAMWPASSKASPIAVTGLGRRFALNVPRGLGLDVVDAATGIIKTYHLDSGTGFFQFPQAGKILITEADGTAAVWSIPPRRSYRAVKTTAWILAAVAVAVCALILVVRLVWRLVRRYRGRQLSAPSLEVQL